MLPQIFETANPLYTNLRTVSSGNYTTVVADDGLLLDVDTTAGGLTVTALAAATAQVGYRFAVRKKDSSANAVTISGPSVGTTSLTQQGDVVVVFSTGSTYYSISQVPFALSIQDDRFTITGSADTTKKLVAQVDTQGAGFTLTFDVGAQTASRSLSVPVLTASDTIATLGVANVFSALQTVDLGTGATGSTQGTFLRLIAADAGSVSAAAMTFGSTSGAIFTSQNIGGTRASQSATANAAAFWTFTARGHDGTSQTGTKGSFGVQADGLWSGTNNGTVWTWSGTPNGSVTLAEWLRLTDACLLVGTTTKMTGVTGGLTLAGTTDATSSTTGTAQIAGGVGIVKNLVLSQGLGLGVTSTATAAGTTTLTTASDAVQIFTGTTTQNVTLPAANGFGAGQGIVYIIKNRSTGALTVNRAGSDTIEGATSLNIAAGVTETLISNGVSEWERC